MSRDSTAGSQGRDTMRRYLQARVHDLPPLGVGAEDDERDLEGHRHGRRRYAAPRAPVASAPAASRRLLLAEHAAHARGEVGVQAPGTGLGQLQGFIRATVLVGWLLQHTLHATMKYCAYTHTAGQRSPYPLITSTRLPRCCLFVYCVTQLHATAVLQVKYTHLHTYAYTHMHAYIGTCLPFVCCFTASLLTTTANSTSRLHRLLPTEETTTSVSVSHRNELLEGKGHDSNVIGGFLVQQRVHEPRQQPSSLVVVATAVYRDRVPRSNNDTHTDN